jgi:hypothetical protein
LQLYLNCQTVINTMWKQLLLHVTLICCQWQKSFTWYEMKRGFIHSKRLLDAWWWRHHTVCTRLAVDQVMTALETTERFLADSSKCSTNLSLTSHLNGFCRTLKGEPTLVEEKLFGDAPSQFTSHKCRRRYESTSTWTKHICSDLAGSHTNLTGAVRSALVLSSLLRAFHVFLRAAVTTAKCSRNISL